ncbi:hypothetical protein ACI3PL_26740, partial [Lacticaseibacillus paracasei]
MLTIKAPPSDVRISVFALTVFVSKNVASLITLTLAVDKVDLKPEPSAPPKFDHVPNIIAPFNPELGLTTNLDVKVFPVI